MCQLPTFLSRLLVAYTIEFDNEFEQHMPHTTALFGAGGPAPRVSSSGTEMGRPWLASLAMWANGMRYVPPDGVPLASLDGLGANLAGLQRWRYLRADGGTVRPTRAGRFAQAVWERLEGAIERRWERRFGADLVAELRASLLAVAEHRQARRPDGERALPLYLPVVGHGMRTTFVSPTDEQLALAGAADAAGLGLSALLSRALLLVTLAYERRAPLALPIGADIVPTIGTQGGAAMRELPLRSGVSKEAVSVATKFLERHGYATIGAVPSRAIALTERGGAELDAYQRRIPAIEDAWAERRGAAEVARLRACVLAFAERRAEDGRAALALGLEPYPDGWRAQRRYRRQTDAFVADPWTALPRHPMVLHRGGFPDGS
jgi:hypothetical protein